MRQMMTQMMQDPAVMQQMMQMFQNNPNLFAAGVSPSTPFFAFFILVIFTGGRSGLVAEPRPSADVSADHAEPGHASDDGTDDAGSRHVTADDSEFATSTETDTREQSGNGGTNGWLP